MACVADVSRAAAVAAPSVSGCVVPRSNAARVSVSPFFNQGLKALQVRSRTTAPASNATPSSLVVNMAKREEELADIRKMSDEDIKTTVVDLKGELFLLRTKQATRQEYKSSEFRRIRKNVNSPCSFPIADFRTFNVCNNVVSCAQLVEISL